MVLVFQRRKKTVKQIVCLSVLKYTQFNKFVILKFVPIWHQLSVIHQLTIVATTCPDPWWRHQMETFSALLAICAGNSPISGEFPAQRPVTRSVDIIFDVRLNKQLSKQLWGWWFETQSGSLWRHCNARCPLQHQRHERKLTRTGLHVFDSVNNGSRHHAKPQFRVIPKEGLLLQYIFLLVAVDECKSGTHDCSTDALCFNTRRSFRCRCKSGFYGNGKICLGEEIWFIFRIVLVEKVKIASIRNALSQHKAIRVVKINIKQIEIHSNTYIYVYQ